MSGSNNPEYPSSTEHLIGRELLGPLKPLLDDQAVTEIMVNGRDHVYVERDGILSREAMRFDTDERLFAAARFIAQTAQRTLDNDSPVLDARLSDGSRVCIVLPPIADRGISINIRRFSQKFITLKQLHESGSITHVEHALLLEAVRQRDNIIISGGTGSGKTTLLNAIAAECSDHERLVVIEDTRELSVPQEHVVYLEARPAIPLGPPPITIRDLFIASLRMRPDRVLVGECRGGEALDLLQAMSSGHRGCMTTLHANSPRSACFRLETMCMMTNIGIPLVAIRRQIGLAIDLFVQVERRHDGSRGIAIIQAMEAAEDDGYTFKNLLA